MAKKGPPPYTRRKLRPYRLAKQAERELQRQRERDMMEELELSSKMVDSIMEGVR